MGKATGDRASRRKRNIIIAKAQRKLAAIRDKAARETVSNQPETKATYSLGAGKIYYDGKPIGGFLDMKETEA